MKIIVYQKPTCSTCRQVHRELTEAGVAFDRPIIEKGARAILARPPGRVKDIL